MTEPEPTDAVESSAVDPWAELNRDMTARDTFHVLRWEPAPFRPMGVLVRTLNPTRRSARKNDSGPHGAWFPVGSPVMGDEQTFDSRDEAEAFVNQLAQRDRAEGLFIRYAIERRFVTSTAEYYLADDMVGSTVARLRQAREEATRLLLDGKESIGPDSIVWQLINQFDQLDRAMRGTSGWPDPLPEEDEGHTIDPNSVVDL